jgi:hypothetical protein
MKVTQTDSGGETAAYTPDSSISQIFQSPSQENLEFIELKGGVPGTVLASRKELWGLKCQM